MNLKSNNNLLETFNNPNVDHDFLIKIKINYQRKISKKIYFQ